jgi:hypothetical protein
MAIPFATDGTLGVDLSAVWAAPSTGVYSSGDQPPFDVGTMIIAKDSSVWHYVKYGTGGATGLGYVVVIDEDWLAVMMSNSVGAPGDKLAVAPAAALVNNYGWVQVYGTCDNIRVSASCAANVQLASTTTAGELDDAVANPTKNVAALGDLVLTTARAASAGLAPGELNYPVVGTTN